MVCVSMVLILELLDRWQQRLGFRVRVIYCMYKVGFTTLRLRFAQPCAWASGHRVVDKSNERIDIMKLLLQKISPQIRNP
eukprot:12632-Chlamydomonas_euryale.AAC.1